MKCPGCADDLRLERLPGGAYIRFCFGCMTWWESDPRTEDPIYAGDLVRRNHPGPFRAGELHHECLLIGICIRFCFGCMTWWELDPHTMELVRAGDLVRRDHPDLHCDLCGKPVPRKSAWVECPFCVALEEKEKEQEPAAGGAPMRRQDCLSWRLCANKSFGLVDCRGCEGFKEWKEWMQ